MFDALNFVGAKLRNEFINDQKLPASGKFATFIDDTLDAIKPLYNIFITFAMQFIKCSSILSHFFRWDFILFYRGWHDFRIENEQRDENVDQNAAVQMIFMGENKVLNTK